MLSRTIRYAGRLITQGYAGNLSVPRAYTITATSYRIIQPPLTSDVRRLHIKSSMPSNVEAEHKKIISTIKSEHVDNLMKIYKIIKNPSASSELVDQFISSAKFPEVTKKLLQQLANRKKFAVAGLAGLPDKDETIGHMKELNSYSGRGQQEDIKPQSTQAQEPPPKPKYYHVKPSDSPFDIIRTVIRNGRAVLDISGEMASYQHDAVRAFIHVIDTKRSDYFYIADDFEENQVIYGLKNLGSENILQAKINQLQQKMSQGWSRRGDVFFKQYKSKDKADDLINNLIEDCYYRFLLWANIKKFEYNYFDFCRIFSKNDFLKFQKALLGREVSLSEPGILLSASEATHHQVDFIEAIVSGREDVVSGYLLDGIDPVRGIYAVARTGNIRIAEMLWRVGAGLYDEKSLSERTMLHEAAMYNRLEFAQYLIKNRKINIDQFALTGNYCETALHFICEFHDNPEFVDLLVKSGSKINLQDRENGKKGATALHKAIKSGAIKSTKELLELGADPLIVNSLGYSAFECAVYYIQSSGLAEIRKEILATLLEYAIDKNLAKEEAYLRQHGAGETYPKPVSQQKSTLKQLSLPILSFYESRFDMSTRKTLHLLLPFLAEKGYQVFCFEDASENLTRGLPFYPAEIELDTLMGDLNKFDMRYQGIDESAGSKRLEGGSSHGALFSSPPKNDSGQGKRLSEAVKSSSRGAMALMTLDREPGVRASLQKELTKGDLANSLSFHIYRESNNTKDIPLSNQLYYFELKSDPNNQDHVVQLIKKLIELKINEMQLGKEGTPDTQSASSRFKK